MKRNIVGLKMAKLTLIIIRFRRLTTMSISSDDLNDSGIPVKIGTETVRSVEPDAEFLDVIQGVVEEAGISEFDLYTFYGDESQCQLETVNAFPDDFSTGEDEPDLVEVKIRKTADSA